MVYRYWYEISQLWALLLLPLSSFLSLAYQGKVEMGRRFQLMISNTFSILLSKKHNTVFFWYLISFWHPLCDLSVQLWKKTIPPAGGARSIRCAPLSINKSPPLASSHYSTTSIDFGLQSCIDEMKMACPKWLLRITNHFTSNSTPQPGWHPAPTPPLASPDPTILYKIHTYSIAGHYIMNVMRVFAQFNLYSPSASNIKNSKGFIFSTSCARGVSRWMQETEKYLLKQMYCNVQKFHLLSVDRFLHKYRYCCKYNKCLLFYKTSSSLLYKTRVRTYKYLHNCQSKQWVVLMQELAIDHRRFQSKEVDKLY